MAAASREQADKQREMTDSLVESPGQVHAVMGEIARNASQSAEHAAETEINVERGSSQTQRWA